MPPDRELLDITSSTPEDERRERTAEVIEAEKGLGAQGIKRVWKKSDSAVVVMTSDANGIAFYNPTTGALLARFNPTGMAISRDDGTTAPAVPVVSGTAAGGGLAGTYPNPTLTGSPSFTNVTALGTLSVSGNTTLSGTLTVGSTTSLPTTTIGSLTVTNAAAVGAHLSVAGPVTFAATLSPATITADQNDYGPSGWQSAFLIRVVANAARTITGISSVAIPDGRMLVFRNVDVVNNFGITFAHESASSSAANRMNIKGGSRTLQVNETLWLLYDGVSDRWVSIDSA